MASSISQFKELFIGHKYKSHCLTACAPVHCLFIVMTSLITGGQMNGLHW